MPVAFTGWPVEAVEFFEGLEDDNSRAYWQAHTAVYDGASRARCWRSSPSWRTSSGRAGCSAPTATCASAPTRRPTSSTAPPTLTGGYVSVSADELFAGSGLYMPMPDELKRFRAAIDADRTGAELEHIVATLRKAKYDVGAHDTLKTAPRGYPKDHPRIELLQLKGIVMSKSWPVGGWLGTKKAKDRVVTTLEAARRSTRGSPTTSASRRRSRP